MLGKGCMLLRLIPVLSHGCDRCPAQLTIVVPSLFYPDHFKSPYTVGIFDGSSALYYDETKPMQGAHARVVVSTLI